MKFKELDKKTKQKLHEELSKYAQNVGGKNAFLTMIEDIRSIKNPLLKKTNSLHYDSGKIYWNKSIFQDKNDLLFQTMKKIEIENSMTKGLNNYKIKKVTNMLKALKPVMFEVVPNDKNLEGFKFYIITENNEIDIIFKIIFFYNIGFAKEVLNYKA
jgi:hypothetical protein